MGRMFIILFIILFLGCGEAEKIRYDPIIKIDSEKERNSMNQDRASILPDYCPKCGMRHLVWNPCPNQQNNYTLHETDIWKGIIKMKKRIIGAILFLVPIIAFFTFLIKLCGWHNMFIALVITLIVIAACHIIMIGWNMMIYK